MTTLALALVSRAAGRPVSAGEVVTCRVDLAMMHDSGGPRRVEPILRRLGAPLHDPSRVVLISDHYVPGDTEAGAAILALTRDWARERGVTFHDGEGICHVVLPERGHVAPGAFIVGGDSHSPTGGAFGAYMFGVGATDMAGVLVTGETWLPAPETLLIEWRGRFGEGVAAKDAMLFLCTELGLDAGRGRAIQYAGEAVRALSMQERMTLSNMAAELGGQTGLIAPDETTAAYVAAAGGDPGDWRRWAETPEALAAAEERRVFDAAALPPMVAAPHSPANGAPAAEHGDAVDVAYIGACTGAKYDDLAAAARVLKGRRAAPGVTLLVAPASARDQARAAADGVLGALEAAGARLLPNACGICAGYGAARLPAGARCISSTARNFRGRMGDRDSLVWLASPLTVAASAVAGRIVDPREMLAEARP